MLNTSTIVGILVVVNTGVSTGTIFTTSTILLLKILVHNKNTNAQTNSKNNTTEKSTSSLGVPFFRCRAGSRTRSCSTSLHSCNVVGNLSEGAEHVLEVASKTDAGTNKLSLSDGDALVDVSLVDGFAVSEGVRIGDVLGEFEGLVVHIPASGHGGFLLSQGISVIQILSQLDEGSTILSAQGAVEAVGVLAADGVPHRVQVSDVFSVGREVDFDSVATTITIGIVLVVHVVVVEGLGEIARQVDDVGSGEGVGEGVIDRLVRSPALGNAVDEALKERGGVVFLDGAVDVFIVVSIENEGSVGEVPGARGFKAVGLDVISPRGAGDHIGGLVEGADDVEVLEVGVDNIDGALVHVELGDLGDEHVALAPPGLNEGGGSGQGQGDGEDESDNNK